MAVEKRLELAQSRLEAGTCEDLEAFVEAVLTSTALGKRVYIKDRRHRHTVLIAGIRSDVARVRSMAIQAFASVAQQNPKLVATSSAHLPLYDHSALSAMLDDVYFKPPRFAIVGIDGADLAAGTQDQAAIRRMVAHAAMGLMNTGNVVEKAAQLSGKLVIVGLHLAHVSSIGHT